MSRPVDNSRHAAVAACRATIAAGAAVIAAGASAWDVSSPAEEARGASSLREMLRPTFESCSVLNGRNIVLGALADLPGGYGEADWDAYGAEPLSAAAWRNAIGFAMAMPETMEAADVGADADGDVTFEWRHSSDDQCLLTFSSDGVVYCNVRSAGDKIAAVMRAGETDRILKLVCEVADV